MKPNKQILSFTIFRKRKFEIESKIKMNKNMQLKNSSIVFITCGPEFLTRPTFNVDGLCTFYKLVVQKLELVL